MRRIASVSLITPAADGVAIQTIASNELGSDSFVLADAKTLQAALSDKFDTGQLGVSAAMQAREQCLEKLMAEGTFSRDEVRKAVLAFYKSRQSQEP